MLNTAIDWHAFQEVSVNLVSTEKLKEAPVPPHFYLHPLP